MAIDIDEAVSDIYDVVTSHRAYNPAHASLQDSLEYLEGVRSTVDDLIAGIRHDMAVEDD